MGDVLREEHIRKAIKMLGQPLDIDRRLPITSLQWDDYKKCLSLSEEQMHKLFIITQYIEMLAERDEVRGIV